MGEAVVVKFEMNRASNVNIVPFTKTIRPIVLAPLAGLAVLTFVMLLVAQASRLPPRPALGPRPDGPSIIMLAAFMALWIAPFCYGAAALFVLPALVIWPRLRRPSYAVAAVSGASAATAAVVLLGWIATPRPNRSATLGQIFQEPGAVRTLAVLWGASGASGLLYAQLIRRSTTEHPN